MYLLDTNVVSEARKAASGKADPHVVSWLNGVAAGSLFLSAIVVLELELGVRRIERRDKLQGAALRRWLDDRVLATFTNRILGRVAVWPDAAPAAILLQDKAQCASCSCAT